MASKAGLLERAARAYLQLKASQALQRGTSPGEVHGPLGGIFLGEHRISLDLIYTVWRNHGDVFGCVREVQETVGVAGYEWLNANDGNAEPDVTAVRRAEQVLNAKRTFRRLKSAIIQSERISGNAYLHLEKSADGKGSPLALQPVDPRTMRCVTDKYGTIRKWIQQVGSETVEFEPDEILHFTTVPDPNGSVFGMAPIETIIWDLRSDIAAMMSNYAFFQNDGVPAAQYILDEGLTEQQATAAIKELRDQISGSENRHKAVAIRGIKEIKVLTPTNKEMEFEMLRRLTTEKACAAFGVPKSILGYTDDVNYANGAEQTQKFWEGTVSPMQEALAEFINTRVLPAIGVEGIKLQFKVRSFDNKEFVEASTRADVQLGIMTINEAREARGKEPFDPKQQGEGVDKPMIYGGLGTRFVEDVGADFAEDVPAVMDEQAQEKALRVVDARRPERHDHEPKRKRRE